MSKQERAVVLGVGLIAVVLLLLVLWPRDKAPARSASAAPAPQVERRTTPERPRDAPERAPAPAPRPEATEEADPDRPPPLTGLILTFPPGMPEDDMQAQLAKCDVVEVRRSRHYVKVVPAEGTSYAQVKECFRFGDVVVGEERGGPPPSPRP